MDLKPDTRAFNCRGYWKFNEDLLENEEYCGKVREWIGDINKDNQFSSIWSKWEFLKHKISEFSIRFSKK